MELTHLRLERRGAVAILHLDRPPANALDLELLSEGTAALEEVAKGDASALVIAGARGFFSGGVDLKVAPTLDHAGQRRMVEGINRLFADLYAFERPLVAAVTGHAIAGGLILALCADYRVGSTEGKLGLTELRVGIGFPAAAMAVVRAVLAPHVARELVLRADLLDPPAALERGMVDELVEPDAVLPRALEMAEELATLPGETYVRVKRQLRAEVVDHVQRVVAEGSDPLLDSWLGDETAEAAAATLLRGGRS
jgi:enoyl-CoA hydratase